MTSIRWILLVCFALAGCSGDAEDSGPVALPPIDTDPVYVPDTGGFPIDTGPDTGRDESPAHLVTIEQAGEWELSPFGGPYTSLVGTLHAMEYLDGLRPPEDSAEPTDDTGDYPEDALLCDVTWSLVGAPVDELCEGCDFAFTIEFYVVEGDPDDCRDPDVPLHGELRRFGFSEDDQVIYQDLGDAGLWLPWYDAWRAGDRVSFQYIDTWGIGLEDEEEEE